MSTRSKRSAASAASSYELPATPAKMAKLNNISAAAAIEGKKQQKTVVAEKGRYTRASNTTSGCTLSLYLCLSQWSQSLRACDRWSTLQLRCTAQPPSRLQWPRRGWTTMTALSVISSMENGSSQREGRHTTLSTLLLAKNLPPPFRVCWFFHF